MSQLLSITSLQYGLDSLQVSSLLTCLLPPAPPNQPIWAIVDSTWGFFWEDLGSILSKMGWPMVGNWGMFVSNRPRNANKQVEIELGRRMIPRVWVDTTYTERLRKPNVRSRVNEIESVCLRLRLDIPASKLPRAGVVVELERLIRAILDVSKRPFLANRMPSPTEAYQTALEMTLKLNPALGSWPMIQSCLLFPVNHAVLYGRDSVEDQDWLATYGMLRWCVRPLTRDIIEELVRGQGYRKPRSVMEQSGLGKTRTGMGRYRSRRLAEVKLELARLVDTGICAVKYAGGLHRADGLEHVRPQLVGLSDGWGLDAESFMTGEMVWWK